MSGELVMDEVFLPQFYSCWDDLLNVFLIFCGANGSERVGAGGEMGEMDGGREGKIYI